ncbi:MAG: nitroreductase family deazaflavin-dependent oxidoreductase [Anaerolineaceae bacterium]|nr:nitroreductase family deazaflavin-dependent oxidoreductase [Anaerolineaceae bacterium]
MNSLTYNHENSLRQAFRYINQLMLWMWRLGLGKTINVWPAVIGRIMVITHTGRKSGARRQTPVNYAMVDGDIYCTAGFGSSSDWYRNICKDPNVEIWLPDGWWAGSAEEISDSPERLRLLRQVLAASGFAARAAGINPHTIPDVELDRLTLNYRLLRITRTEARTGQNGPGEFAWIWPLATMILLPALLLSNRKKSRR